MAKKETTGKEEKPVLYQTLIVKSARIEAAGIDTWQNALNSAKRGERSRLYDLYDNILADTILSNAVEKRINAITNAELAFIRDGKNVEDIDDLIDSTEFEELLREIVLSKAYGKSVIEIMFNPHFNIFSYPRRNIRITNLDRPLSEHKKFIAAKDTDREGYDFTQDKRFIECGKDDDLGFLFKAAPYVIYKRGGFGDWAQFVEIFGMPFLLGKYNSYDEKSRDMLFEALEKIGSNPRAAIPEGTDIEIHENKSTGTSSLYKDFRAACNEEMLISVLGNTMTTVQGDKGARSLGEVHQDTEEKINAADRRFVARTLNRYLLPLLIERGYNAAGGYFVFPDAGENMTVIERIDLALKIRKEGIPVSDEYIYDVSGVPKPDKAQSPAKSGDKKNKPAETPDSNSLRQFQANSVEKVEANSNTNPPTSPVSPYSLVSPISPFRRLIRFFVQAPAATTGAIRNYITKSTANTLTLADGTSIDIAAIFLEALRNIYQNAGGKQALIEKSLYMITNLVLQSGIDKTFSTDFGVEFGKKNEDFVNQFKYNAAVFSAFKNHQQTNELVALLNDENGNLRSFREFRKLANQVSKDYNVKWLQTEYNTAVRAARAAVNWKKALESKHLYPNFEYMLSTAPTKTRRIIHESWVGTVLPIEHTWWNTHMPPSDWNCKCSVRQTDKPETAIPVIEDDNNPVFRNNPGKTAQFIKLSEHPYIKRKCPFVGNCDRQNLQLSDHPYRPECEICLLAKTWYKNQKRIEENRKEYERLLKDENYKDIQFNPTTGGLMATHTEHNFDKKIGNHGIKRGEYETRSRDVLYNYGMKIILESEKKGFKIKTPDGTLNDSMVEIKGIEEMGASTIKNKFLKGRKQGANTIVLYYHKNSVFSTDLLNRGYQDYINETTAKNKIDCINEIYYIIENKLHRFK